MNRVHHVVDCVGFNCHKIKHQVYIFLLMIVLVVINVPSFCFCMICSCHCNVKGNRYGKQLSTYGSLQSCPTPCIKMASLFHEESCDGLLIPSFNRLLHTHYIS